MVCQLPATLPLRRAALAEPLAVALHAVAVGGGVRGKRVLVSGSGPIGLLAVAACTAEGAQHVVATDLLPEPLRRAQQVGAHDSARIGVEEVPASSFDVVLECSGAPAAVTSSLAAARRAGVVVQVGMLSNALAGVNLAPLVSKELQLRGAFRFDDEIDRAVDLLDTHPDIEHVVTHELPAARAHDAFAIAKDSDASGKVLLSLWQGPDR